VSVEFRDTQWTSVPVDGANLLEVAQTISQLAEPWKEAGNTEWTPRYGWETTAEVVSGVTVTVDTRVTLPIWTQYDSASQPEKTEWDRFCGALRAHEQGHLDLVHDRLSDVDQRMLGKSLSDAIQAWQDAQTALQSSSDAYDASTDHGRNAGTVIDVSVVS
jgi:predicted secreted Zn-dependent protease